jgi:hypothetical protein
MKETLQALKKSLSGASQKGKNPAFHCTCPSVHIKHLKESKPFN